MGDFGLRGVFYIKEGKTKYGSAKGKTGLQTCMKNRHEKKEEEEEFNNLRPNLKTVSN